MRRPDMAAVAVALAGALSATACHGSTEPVDPNTGVVVQVYRGPIDPVETQENTPNVAPVAGARVMVHGVDGDAAADRMTDGEGTVRIPLEPGTYSVSVVGCPGAMSLPKEDAVVTVTTGSFASAELVCDTGIR